MSRENIYTETSASAGSTTFSPTTEILSNTVQSAIEEVNTNTLWLQYAINFATDPTFVQTIAAGDVYSYDDGTTQRYRLVPSPYDATLDAFYASFSAGTLSTLLISRV